MTPPPPRLAGANWANRTLFHGDNLPVLRGMNSGSVDLIATDPPFNKGRDFHATPESLASGAKFQDRWRWDDDVEGDWIDQLQDDWPNVWHVISAARSSWGDDLGAFLCFMAVRLLEMHRILKAEGSLYLHCDPTASHYLKQLLDAIFGKSQFRNEIVWRRTGSHNSSNRFGPIHDVLLFYARSDAYRHRPVFTPYLKGHVDTFFKKRDEIGRYWTNSIHGSGTRNGASGQPWRGFDPTAEGRHWAVPGDLVTAFGIDPDLPQHDKLDALFELGLIDLPSGGGLPTYRQYLHTSPGQILQDVWAFQPHTNGVLHQDDAGIDEDVRWIPPRDKKERTGYPTQKPLGLLERIIKSSSDPDDIVVDPFCGCATTPVAAERLGRQWVGIDIWDGAYDQVLQRLQKEGLTAPDSSRDDNRMFVFGNVTYRQEPPARTDGGETAAPFLQVTERVDEPPGPRWTRAEMYEHLLTQHGPVCQGCDRTFDDKRYLQLDHNTPRADGGINHISNRVLLCGPCNQLKSNIYTLSGLRRQNRKLGYMAKTPPT